MAVKRITWLKSSQRINLTSEQASSAPLLWDNAKLYFSVTFVVFHDKNFFVFLLAILCQKPHYNNFYRMALLYKVWNLLDIVRSVNDDWCKFTQKVIDSQTTIRCRWVLLNQTYLSKRSQVLDDVLVHIDFFDRLHFLIGCLFGCLFFCLSFDFGEVGLDFLLLDIDFG